MGEENFLKEAFLPPYPHLSRTLKRGDIFYIYIVRSTVVHTIFALKTFHVWKFLSTHAQLSRTLKRGDIFYIYIVRSTVKRTMYALYQSAKVFVHPRPTFKNFETWGIFFYIYIVRSTVVHTIFALKTFHVWKFLVLPFFKKVAKTLDTN